MAANQALLGTSATMAGGKGVTPTRLALSWVLHAGDVIVPIPGAPRVRHLEENASAAAVVLSANELAAIDRAMPRTAISAQRRQGDPRLQRRVDLRLVFVVIARSVYRVVPKQGPLQASGSSVWGMAAALDWRRLVGRASRQGRRIALPAMRPASRSAWASAAAASG